MHIYTLFSDFHANSVFGFDAKTTDAPLFEIKNAIINIRVGNSMLPFT